MIMLSYGGFRTCAIRAFACQNTLSKHEKAHQRPKKRLATHVFNKELVSKLHKKLLQVNLKKMMQ